MDGARGQGIPRVESDNVAGIGGTTSRMDQRISCVRGRIRYNNRQHSHAVHPTKVVLAGVLRQLEALTGRTKLLYDRKRSLGNDV